MVLYSVRRTMTIKENDKRYFTFDDRDTFVYFTLFSSFIAIMPFMLETSYENKKTSHEPSARDW
jgi:hypothetical protein